MLTPPRRSRRSTGGCFDGSWDAQAQTGLGRERGRLQATVYAKLSLEVCYCHAQIPEAATPGK